MLGTKPIASPMDPGVKLYVDQEELMTEPERYSCLSGKLTYLYITGPDITFAVNSLSQFMSVPRVPHWEALLRVVKYLKNHPNLDLCYRAHGHLCLEGFTDSDWARDPNNRRSMTGYCTFLGGNLVSWMSKKQKVVSKSSAEVEYRAIAYTSCELIWIHSLLKQIGFIVPLPLHLHYDNQATIHIASNPVFHERTKHIGINCHHVREKVRSSFIDTTFYAK
ncbi:hypothetical protein Dimus_038222 [Dionaea muscipula]